MTGLTSRVLDVLEGSGLLLQQDKRYPNVVTLITGEFLHSSWWSHPKGHLIFAALSELADHPDILFTKLLYQKVTLVHRKLWPAFLAVALANEPWQLRELSSKARYLLTRVKASNVPVRGTGQAVKELEFRLLVHTEEIHTESGSHQRELETWPVWGRRVRVKPLRSPLIAREHIEKAAQAIGIASSAFPWSR